MVVALDVRATGQTVVGVTGKCASDVESRRLSPDPTRRGSTNLTAFLATAPVPDALFSSAEAGLP